MRAFTANLFAYRRLYVDAIIEMAPRRRTLAVAAEIARLAFLAVACALFALVFWLLTVAAFARPGPLIVWPIVFGACAICSTFAVLLAVLGLGRAASDLRRVRRAVEKLS